MGGREGGGANLGILCRLATDRLHVQEEGEGVEGGDSGLASEPAGPAGGLPGVQPVCVNALRVTNAAKYPWYPWYPYWRLKFGPSRCPSAARLSTGVEKKFCRWNGSSGRKGWRRHGVRLGTASVSRRRACAAVGVGRRLRVPLLYAPRRHLVLPGIDAGHAVPSGKHVERGRGNARDLGR